MRIPTTFIDSWTAALSRLAPPSLSEFLLTLVADVAYVRGGPLVRATKVGIRLVLGASATPILMRNAVRRAVRAYVLSRHELWRLPKGSAELTDQLVTTVEITGIEHLESSGAAGNGAVLTLPHMFGMELAGARLALHYGGLVAMASRAQVAGQSEIYRLLSVHTGLTIVLVDPADRLSALESIRAIRRQLSGNGLVCVLADQPLGGPKVEVTMFNQELALSAGPAKLALHAKAPLHPVTVWRDGPTVCCEIHPAVPTVGPDNASADDVASNMMRYCAQVFEPAIRQHPEDWQLISLLANHS